VVWFHGIAGIRDMLSYFFALPLCGAAVTFFAAAKKDNQRKRLQPPVPESEALRHRVFEPSRRMRETL
jgi:hypothetical protein